MPNCFWVNQGLTYQEEVRMDCLWSPEVQKDGRSRPKHWENMKLLQPGDIVLNYSKQMLRGYCEVVNSAVSEPRPYQAGTEYDPNQGGHLVAVNYVQLQKPIAKDDILKIPGLADALLSDTDPPLLQTSRESFNQIYLARITNPDTANVLLRLVGATSHKVAGPAIPPGSTEAIQLSLARIGQGQFRKDLLKMWAGRCAVTGLNVESLLIASHIRPWRSANNIDRLNPLNGLLLAAGVDKAFDRLLISFDQAGQLVTKLDGETLACIGIRSLAGKLPRISVKDEYQAGLLREHHQRYLHALRGH